MDIKQDEKLVEWLENIEASTSTRKLYITFMNMYCECIGKSPTELISESIQEIKDGKLPAERNISSYFARFKKCMSEKRYSPKSFNTGLAVVNSFYKSYDIPMPNKLKTKRALPVKENQTFITREDVRKLVLNAKNLREKAIILCMATSGMARQEIINLRVGDISFDAEDIGTVSIRRQKSQTDYITFVSPEATSTLKTYFEERNRGHNTKIKGNNDYVFVTYDSGKNVAENTFIILFNILGRQLGYENGGGYIKTHSHSLRKFFASTLEDNGCPKAKVDFMLGHVGNDTDLAYFKRDPDKLKELYKRFLPYITFEKTIEVRSLDTQDAKRLSGLEKENELLKEKLESKDTETQDLKKRLDKLESALQAIINTAGKK